MADRSLVSPERIASSVLCLRGVRVLLDADLAGLYGVGTKTLVQAARRNRERFPADFMFQLTLEEYQILRSQSGTSSSWGGRRYRPYAFSKQGVAMLSSVLRSPRAVREQAYARMAARAASDGRVSVSELRAITPDDVVLDLDALRRERPRIGFQEE